MNACRKCGRKPQLFSYAVFGIPESGTGFYDVRCVCGERSGRHAKHQDAVMEWNRGNPRTGGVVSGLLEIAADPYSYLPIRCASNRDALA